ncbi:MAG: DMT family transporter [Thermodesulfovibrionales bacterium]|nr:DMT family transporter [Thermodesulfovibrionales bacterium]
MLDILIAILIWSSLGVIIKTTPISIQDLIFFAGSTSSLILFVFFIIKDKKALKISFKFLSIIFAISIVGLVNTFTFFYAYKNTSIPLAVLTHYTAPFFVAIFAHIFLKERITYKTILSIITATIGMYIMLDIKSEEILTLISKKDRNTLGIISGLLSGIFYAFLIIMFKYFIDFIKPTILTMYQNLFVVCMLTPFVSFDYDFFSVAIVVFILGVLHSTIAPIIYLRGIKKVRANIAAILGYSEPICAIILGIILLGEKITFNILVGGSMILISGLYCILSKSDSKRTEQIELNNLK